MAAAVTITTFAGLAPPWSLTQLDTNVGNLQTAFGLQNNFSNYLVDAGAANAYVVTPAAGITGTLTAGLVLQFKTANANTGASTLNYNALGVKNILNMDGSALSANQILATGITQVVYDGTQFVLLNPSTPLLSFTSAETAIGAAASNTTVNHGLAAVPRLITLTLRNKTAELGYSIGDEVSFIGQLTGLGIGISLYADATVVGIVRGSTTAGVLGVFRKDTGVIAAFTEANWKYVVRAWR